MSTRRKYKTYKELSFTDDFLFCNIMQNNPDICKELVELLLGRKVGKVAYSETQKSIDLALEHKGVRLDVYFEDDLSTAYNIEMQTSNTGNLPKRSRYYQGTVDLNMISSGAGYDELKTSYIIFINTFDLFGKGFPKYTFENICQESSDLHLDDGAVKVFINAKSTIPGMSPELQGFLRYLCGGNPDTPLTDRIQNEVVKIVPMDYLVLTAPQPVFVIAESPAIQSKLVTVPKCPFRYVYKSKHCTHYSYTAYSRLITPY